MTTREAYDAIAAVNWSTLREMRKSPLAYRHRLATPREDSDALRLGRAVHTSVLEPDRFPLEYVVWSGGRKAGAEWTAFQAANEARTILTEEQYGRCIAIRNAVRACPVAMGYLANGDAERTLEWLDITSGLRLKGRADWVPRSAPAVVDLKTARSAADPRRFAADVFRLGYHCQLAMYRAGFAATTGTERESLGAVIIAVEPEAPHDVCVYRLDDDALVAGEEEVAELLARLVECRASDRWPGRFEGEQTLSLPRWAFPSDDDGLDDLTAASESLMEG